MKLLPQDYRLFNYGSDEYAEEESSTAAEDIDPIEAYYQKWGYLPQFDEEAAAVIQAIIENPDLARIMGRTDPNHYLFYEGLDDRNVFLSPSETSDPQADHIMRLSPTDSSQESDQERAPYEHLWALDVAKCTEGSNEVIFQRTVLMNLISRHILIYDKGVGTGSRLDFNVEGTWSTPPMPTRAVWKKRQYLTQPKPDLAVGFRRRSLIPDRI